MVTILRALPRTALAIAALSAGIRVGRAQTAVPSPMLGTMHDELGNGSVTYLVPSLLFANLSILKPRGTTSKLPVVPPPA